MTLFNHDHPYICSERTNTKTPTRVGNRSESENEGGCVIHAPGTRNFQFELWNFCQQQFSPNHKNIYAMIQLKTLLKVIDNSGALIVECINVIGGSRHASLGDEIVCVVKKARTAGIENGPAASAANAVSKLKKGDVTRALVVRARKEVRRLDGTYVRFDDNAAVMLNKQGQPLGNRVLGVVANECRQKRWTKIISMAPKVV